MGHRWYRAIPQLSAWKALSDSAPYSHKEQSSSGNYGSMPSPLGLPLHFLLTPHCIPASHKWLSKFAGSRQTYYSWHLNRSEDNLSHVSGIRWILHLLSHSSVRERWTNSHIYFAVNETASFFWYFSRHISTWKKNWINDGKCVDLLKVKVFLVCRYYTVTAYASIWLRISNIRFSPVASIPS